MAAIAVVTGTALRPPVCRAAEEQHGQACLLDTQFSVLRNPSGHTLSHVESAFGPILCPEGSVSVCAAPSHRNGSRSSEHSAAITYLRCSMTCLVEQGTILSFMHQCDANACVADAGKLCPQEAPRSIPATACELELSCG